VASSKKDIDLTQEHSGGLSWALIQETFQNQTKNDEGGCPFFFIASGALFRKMVPER
jgi:hypothetical protein